MHDRSLTGDSYITKCLIQHGEQLKTWSTTCSTFRQFNTLLRISFKQSRRAEPHPDKSTSPYFSQAAHLFSISSRQFWQPLSFPLSQAGQSFFSEHLSAVFTTSIPLRQEGLQILLSFRNFLKLLSCLLSHGLFHFPLEQSVSKGASLLNGMFSPQGNCYTLARD